MRALGTLLVAAGLGFPAASEAQTGADADFAARCAGPGVVRCYAFDDLVDLTTGHPRTLTEPDDTTSSRMYPPFGGTGLCTGGQCWALDTAQKASGASSLRFEIPSNSPADTSGSFRINFRDDFSVQFGAGEEFYVQYRERFSPEMLRAFQTTNGQPSGWKQSIVGLGDRVGQPIAYSCTAEETVFTQNTKYLGPTFYHGCGFWETMEFFDGTQVRMQHQGPPYCYYPNDPQSGCFRHAASEWMTFKQHVRIGGWGVHSGNRLRVWAARAGQPSVLIFDSIRSHPGGFPFHRTDAASKYGKVWLLPYHTNKSPAEVHPIAYVWYDELIVSRQDIPDPMVSGPPALSLGDVTATEGDTGTTAAVFTARLSAASAQAVTVSYATANQTATAGVDYQAASGTLTIAAGVTTGTIPVSVVGDAAVEPDETFAVNLSAAAGATLADGQGIGTISDDDAPALARRELAHGSSLWEDLSAQTGTAGQDAFRLSQSAWSSYEVMLDGVSGDASPAVLERLAADNVTVLQTGVGAGAGGAVSLRWENASASAVVNQHVRVRSGGCTSACGADDVYRVRAWETTGAITRFNNGGSQATVLVLQNPGAQAVAGRAHFWSGSGALLATHPFTLSGRGTLVLNTSGVSGLSGQAGSITVTHDGGYGGLAGKAVSLEPATGYSFDSPLTARAR